MTTEIPVLPMEDKVYRFISDLESEMKEARREAAKLSQKADILDYLILKLQRDVLDKNHLTFP